MSRQGVLCTRVGGRENVRSKGLGAGENMVLGEVKEDQVAREQKARKTVIRFSQG